MRKRKQRGQIKPTMTIEQMQEFISAGLESKNATLGHEFERLMRERKENVGLMDSIEKASEVESDFVQRGKIHGS